jgi:peptide/nickel transport system permease protein
MSEYLIRRLIVALLTIFVVSLLAFSSIQFIPGDVVHLALGQHASGEAAEVLRHELGLDRPLAEQYLGWLTRLLRGNLGLSMRTREPVMDAIRQRLPVTIELALLATLVAVLVGIPTGIIAAVRQYSAIDQISTVGALIGLSIPDFWLATLLMLFFSLNLKLLPAGGAVPGLLEDPVGNLKRMIMPALALGLPSASVYFRMMRSALLEVVNSDYIRTAYSKGLGERRTIIVHGLKNALIPVVTVGGLEVAWMLGGSFILETIFSLPGLGRATIKAIFDRDFTMLQGSLLVYSGIVIGLSIAVDLLYVYLDPRIRLE